MPDDDSVLLNDNQPPLPRLVTRLQNDLNETQTEAQYISLFNRNQTQRTQNTLDLSSDTSWLLSNHGDANKELQSNLRRQHSLQSVGTNS